MASIVVGGKHVMGLTTSVQERGDLTAFMNRLTERLCCFVSHDLGLDAVDTGSDLGPPPSLRDHTVFLTLGAPIGAAIALSLDAVTIDPLVEAYTAEITIPPDERALYTREALGDILNIVAGSSLTALSSDGGNIEMSTPYTVLDKGTLNPCDAGCWTIRTIRTDAGYFDVILAIPETVFAESKTTEDENFGGVA